MGAVSILLSRLRWEDDPVSSDHPISRRTWNIEIFYVKGKLLILKAWQVTKKLKMHACQAKHISRLNVAHKPPACDLWKDLESSGCLEARYWGQKQGVRLEMPLPA